MTVNRAILVGRLGKDPEVKVTAQNFTIANFSLATSERVKQGEEWKDKTEWHNIVVLGKAAENAGKYLKKGSLVYVEGRIQTRKWQDKEGKDRYTTEILALSVQYLEKAPAKEGNESTFTGPTEEQLSAPTANFDEDDIPF